MPAAVIGDPHRLRQLIVNLVGNAVKFTDSGQVMLDVAVQSRDNNHVELHYAISDTGIGIPDDKQAVIFQAFEQADGSSARRHGGTGLGLAICKRLAELMSGRIWVESEPGRGTTFHFTARFEVSEEALPPTATMECLRGLSVLIVDDCSVNRRILCEMLRTWQMEPAEAADGDEALDTLRAAHRAGHPYAIAIVDSHMPRMSGFALAAQIKSEPNLSDTLLLMLSSGDGPGDMARCRHLGVAAHLMKPAKQSEILRALIVALGHAPTLSPQTVTAKAAQLPPLRVLLAEDSLTNQKLAVATLQRLGHAIETVETGNSALDKLAAEEFDVVLMDVRMPDMDGLEATKIIRAKERVTGGHIPIVALTANAMEGDREICLRAGMDSYMTKPMQAAQLVAAISEALAHGNLNRTPSADPPQNDYAVQEAQIRAEGASHEPSNIVDWQVALETAFNDDLVLTNLINDFLEESPKLLIQLREALVQGELDSAGRAAHTLKGQLQIFGARRAADLALQIERLLQQGDQRVDLWLGELHEATRKVRSALSQRVDLSESTGRCDDRT
jgi:CheY-like chemotaxis protein/HPt (histidine-containing phosphotransfer) domain-containing protein